MTLNELRYIVAVAQERNFRPFTRPAPSRRIALAWRKSFARAQTVEALAQAQAVAHAKIAGIQHLE